MPFPFSKAWFGEFKTGISQDLLLDSKEYFSFHDILIKINSRSSQIDHIVVSKYGIFVIETKSRAGWIFGSPDSEYWTLTLRKSKFKFQNPLRQNFVHIRNISEFLSINPEKIYSVVVFWGDCYFKTPMPENVIKGGLFHNHTNYIKSKNEILFTEGELHSIVSRLQSVKDETTRSDQKDHVQSIKARYGSKTSCPKCGGNLLERTARSGQNIGRKFLGCENFPRCRYIKDL